MIIIAESGATKCDWVVADGGRVRLRFKTLGLNVATGAVSVIPPVVQEAVNTLKENGISCSDVREIHFYAAGLIPVRDEKVPEMAKPLDAVLREYFPDIDIEYASDLLDAARAVCGREKGIAAILGTGSNSCFYDGEKIVKNVRSAGFILGDEGGGTRLGRLFMSDILKGLVPADVAEPFAKEYDVDYMTVVRNVYKSETPAKYLGSFAPWIMARYGKSDYVTRLVEQNFRDFIERALKQYDVANCPVGVVGGFGYACREILQRIGSEYGIRFSVFLPEPMEGLVKYHS